MKLSEYIANQGDERCGELFGVKVRTIGSWRRGERTPRPAQARKIVEATSGVVTMSEIYAAEEIDAEAAS